MKNVQEQLAAEMKIPYRQIEAAVKLMDEGNTIPFIARYRKEVTGALDDTVLRRLSERLTYLRNLESRREEVRAAIAESGGLTDEISALLNQASILAEIEDIYRPFKPHRKTRADAAREKGLLPLAEWIEKQSITYPHTIETEADSYINEALGVMNREDALHGACDIIAERISDDAEARGRLRRLTFRFGELVTTKIGDDEKQVYLRYYDRRERVNTIPGYRVLAIHRAEAEKVIRVGIAVPSDIVMNDLFSGQAIVTASPAFTYMARAAVDAYERLIAPAIEREIRADLFDRASEGAIAVFADNLRHLLLTPPLKGKTVLGFDPGYRTGCKLAVMDPTGKVLATDVIYPTKPHERIADAEKTVMGLISRYHVDVVAIGNGTASKESQLFIAGLIRKYGGFRYAMVSEAGASVYSASALAADEFPDFDVTQRSAVSIGRRLQDALSELVKIDPKSIGVGQYQHDMKPARLSEALGGVVEDCVNAVGVDLNTCSHSLLGYVAGINAAGAKNIVKYREENGAFTRRSDVKKVPRIGAKCYEQCAGFLRVFGSDEVLDSTGVHPESYGAAKKLLCTFGYSDEDVRGGGVSGLSSALQAYGQQKMAEELGIGLPTLIDIVKELEKPGRDMRDELPPAELREDILDMRDLKPGVVLRGVVRNITDFGCFVDIGVHQDGLVHISEMCDRFIRHPSEVVSVGDAVDVAVLKVDDKTNRISLTMKVCQT